ncbi:hypothetical protein CU098_007966 [Rhizopus stolonifer]|uniref:C2H2-type domain-containing protein n=1 Tax=Rhizopus stolonifer TaxID=4846 RepID=A0A367IVN4_RHIST|nr:hypothetical protein CU098_007966 [Rhizopus stolonifer]
MSTIYRSKPVIYKPNDPFFQEGNVALRSIWLQKEAETKQEIAMIQQETMDLMNEYTVQIDCDPCRIKFPSISAYQYHYEAVHQHVCSVCHKIFPGERWLQFHLDEFHDVLLQIKKEKGEKIVFSTPRMRRLHLVDKHHYPRYFPFDLVYTGTLTFAQRKIRDKRKRNVDMHAKTEEMDMHTKSKDKNAPGY